MRQVALAVLPLAIVQGLVEGPRWQMVPAYALAATFFLVWLFTTAGSPRRPGGRTWIRHAGSPLLVSLGVVVLAMAVFVPWALPVFGFPHPRGPYRIGTVTYHWVDAGRHEVFSADATARRELMVQLWYPSSSGTRPRG